MQRVSGEQGSEGRVPPRRGSLVERVAEQLGDEMKTSATDVVSVPLIEDPALVEDIFDDRADDFGEKSNAGRPANGKASNGRVEIDLAYLKSEGFIHPESVRTRRLEEFRIIKRSILQVVAERRRMAEENPNVVMVTSTRPGEGKTFAAVNLALSIALEPDYSVLLVDADVIKPRVARTLGIEADKGVLDLLKDPSLNPDDVTISTNVPGLSVLPALGTNQMSTELLASRRMSQIVQQMANQDPDRIVVFDTPPVLATSEPAALASHVGQIIFAVEAERTTRNAIQEALDLLGPHPNIGFVLNKARRQFGSAQFGAYYADETKKLMHKRKLGRW